MQYKCIQILIAAILKMVSIKKSYYLPFTILLFFAMILPRFNGNQYIVKQEPYDAKYFQNYVEYFRGNPLTIELRPATNWRFLVPLIASYLPFSALTSINVINSFFLALGLFVFYVALQLLNVPNIKRWQALWLFLFSFPMFYYSSIAYVDSAVFLFISISIYATIRNNFWLFFLSILLGLCVKETIAISIPFYLFYHFKNHQTKAILVTIISLFIYIFGVYLIRKYAPLSVESTRNNFWQFDLKSVHINFNRFNSWFSVIASFGLVGLLFLKNILSKTITEIYKNPLYLACLACIGSAWFLYFLSYFSTIADGRIIWLSYFYMLILVVSSQLTVDRK